MIHNTDADRTRRHFVRAVARQQPVTITYLRADGSETIRTVEPFSYTTSKAGDHYVKAMDRTTGECRTWRLDRIASYTLHRGAFTVKRPTSKTDVEMAPAPMWDAATRADALWTTEYDAWADLVHDTEWRIGL